MPNLKVHNKSLLEQTIKAESLLETEKADFIGTLPVKSKGKDGLTKKQLEDKFIHPLDKNVCTKLKELLALADTEGKIDFYANIKLVKSIWIDLVGRSIKCLRFMDSNEPYQKKDKEPIAYGIENLEKYFEKYIKFESLLYGSSNSYRDHIVHVFQTWLLGVVILFNTKGRASSAPFIKSIQLEGFQAKNSRKVHTFEALSMWTIIALCHDLGYPLQKANQVLDATNKMMESFVYNPKMSLDVRFSGVQDIINDHIIRFISSKMEKRDKCAQNSDDIYTGRVQPKYYIKFSKSLEQYSHGVISSIILYKTLVYFLETDFNINEDYYYDEKKVNQYYLRREILRAIAVHTCDDIYHMHSTTLSFLLIVCDDLQEWGRKNWSDLYRGKSLKTEPKLELKSFSEDNIHIVEEILLDNEKQLLNAIRIASYQFEKYKILFRDGQDTDNRSFNFIKEFNVTASNSHKYDIKFTIPKDKPAELSVTFLETTVKEDSDFASFGIVNTICKSDNKVAIIHKVPQENNH